MATSRPRGRQQVLQSTQSQSMREQRKSIVPVPTLNPCQLQLHVHPSRHCSYSQALSCTSCRVDTPRLSRRQSLPYLTQPRAQPTASWRSTLVRMCGYTNSRSSYLLPVGYVRQTTPLLSQLSQGCPCRLRRAKGGHAGLRPKIMNMLGISSHV